MKDDTILVKLGLSQQIKIEITETNKIIIKDKLLGWNFLTGMIEMSLKNAIIYNLIGSLLFGIFCIYFRFEENYIYPIGFFFLYITFTILFAIYYLIKLENFKNSIISWLKE